MTDNKRLTDLPTTSSDRNNSHQKRISLVTIFGTAFFSILLLFIVANSIILLRLADFQSILSQLSGSVLPKVTVSGQAFSKVNQLTYLTARLASSPTQAFRLIAYRDIEDKLAEISDLKLIAADDEILETQLKSITNEFEGLNLLIEERIQIQHQVKQQEAKMYQLHSEAMTLSKTAKLDINSQRNFSWILDFAEIVSLSSKSLALRRLNQVRQINKQILEKFKTLRMESSGIRFNSEVSALDLVVKLESILIVESGMLPTRIQELRSIGQATGRSNFVHNLVEDFARQVQFQSRELNGVIIADAMSTTERIESETGIIKIIAIFSFLFLTGVVFYLQRKIIKRLIALNNSVLKRIKGEKLKLNLNGNDEISDIAQSFNILMERVEKQNIKLEELSLTDGLTGIANRRFLDKNLPSQIKLAKANDKTLSVLMMDIDCFKNFNDHYGHLAGDDCLKKIAGAFKSMIHRKNDFVSRFGGEEFLLVLADTSKEGAEKIALDMIEKILSLKITHEWNTASPYVTLSIGYACFDPQAPITDNELLKRADEALFRAKEKGKNCAVGFDIC